MSEVLTHGVCCWLVAEFDVRTHAVEHGVNRHVLILQMRKQRLGEGAVIARRAVERGLLRIRGEGDQGAARKRGVDRRQAAVEEKRTAFGRARKRLSERIIAAGIENDDVDRVLAFHQLQHDGQVDRLEVEIAGRLQHDVDRQQIIVVLVRYPVSGVVDQRRLGVRDRIGKLADLVLHVCGAEVIAFDDLEAEPFQRRADRLGVVHRVLEFWRGLIGAVADHQSDALLDVRERRRRGEQTHQRKNRNRLGKGPDKPLREAHIAHRVFPHPLRRREHADGNRSEFYGPTSGKAMAERT